MQTSTQVAQDTASAVGNIGAHNTAQIADTSEIPQPNFDEICPVGTLAKLANLQSLLDQSRKLLQELHVELSA